MWYLYFLRCRDNSIYIGITNNLERRLTRHRQGRGCNYTSYRRPIRLIYYETYNDNSLAVKRERYLKGLNKLKKEAIIVGSLRPDPRQDSG